MAGKSADNEDLKVITPSGVACFVHVFEPFAFKAQPGQAAKDPAYSLILCFPEGADLKELKATCKRAAIKKFGDAEKVKAMVQRGQFRWPWRDGADYAEYGEPFVPGATFVTLKTNQAPGVVNERAKEIMNQMDFYAGCMARASCLCWGYDSMGNKGVTLLLNNVQKTGDGTRLSGRQNATDEFGAVEGAGNDDDDFGDDDDFEAKPAAKAAAKGGGKTAPPAKGKAKQASSSFDDDDEDIPF